MEFDNPMTYILSLVFYIIFMVIIWKVPTWSNQPLGTRVLLSILSMPIIYFIIDWQVNKD